MPTKRFVRRRASFELHVNRALANLDEALTSEQSRTRQLNDEERNLLITAEERQAIEQAIGLIRGITSNFKPIALEEASEASST